MSVYRMPTPDTKPMVHSVIAERNRILGFGWGGGTVGGVSVIG